MPLLVSLGLNFIFITRISMLLLLYKCLSVWFGSKGQTEGKGGRRGGWRRRDPCGGGQDGWMAGSHAKEKREGGKMEGGEGTQDGD